MSNAAKVGIVMIIALAVVGYFILKIEDVNLSRSRNQREITATFDDVAGLDKESAVRIAGVRKGHVTRIKVLPDGRAQVTMKVDDDVPLHANAAARVANLGLLGEKYIELDPGTPAAPVLPEGTIALQGTAPASFDDVTNQLSSIATDVKAITTSLRDVLGGPQGEQRLNAIVGNVQSITEEMRALIAANRSNIDATLANTRAITENLRSEIPRLANSIDSVADQISGTVGENRTELREVITNLRGLSSDLRTTAENLNDITGKVKSGEGTMGKLFYSDEAHAKLTSALNAVEGGVTELKNTLGRVSRMQLDLGIKADYLAGLEKSQEPGGVTNDVDSNSRSTIALRLIPNPDVNRFYNIELAQDPRGRRRDKLTIETRTDETTGASTTTSLKQTRFDRDFLISAQAGWTLENVAVRVGLFDSTGGAGVDYRLNDRITMTGEAFDFGKRRGDNPHVRLFSEYTLRKEQKLIPRLFITAGVDDPLNQTAFILGGGIRWKDEDLKYLLGSLPVGK